MKKRWLVFITIPVLAVAFSAGLHMAIGQQAAPTDTKGLKTTKTTAIDLGPEIEGMQGRQLRMRVITLEPGGHVALHDHKDNPRVVYVVHGTLTEHRGGAVNEHRVGETFSENKDTTHWFQNKGKDAVVFVAVDIFRPK